MIENGKVLMIMEPLCDVIVMISFRGPAVGMVDTTTSEVLRWGLADYFGEKVIGARPGARQTAAICR